jgi:hypothetical protein
LGRLILAMSILVLCSFAFVVLHLTLRRPAHAAGTRGPAPILETREDGSVVAVDVQLSIFEQRLMEAEKQSARLAQELEKARKEREQLQERVDTLQTEVRRLRRPAAGPAPERTPPAAETPAETPANLPGEPTPPSPQPGPPGNP